MGEVVFFFKVQFSRDWVLNPINQLLQYAIAIRYYSTDIIDMESVVGVQAGDAEVKCHIASGRVEDPEPVKVEGAVSRHDYQYVWLAYDVAGRLNQRQEVGAA